MPNTDPWNIEDACRNAYPAPRTVAIAGWLLCVAGGRSKRINALNPTRACTTDMVGLIGRTERIDASLGRPTLVRVPDFLPAADRGLDQLGYTYGQEVRTITGDLRPQRSPRDDEVDLASDPGAGWLAAVREVKDGMSDADAIALRETVRCLVLPRVFACRRVAGRAVAVGYAVADGDILVLESVATHPHRRRQGHAEAVVRALLAWGATQGATTACLQVVADNRPALALYRGLGLDTDRYGYHYRHAPARDGRLGPP